MKTNASVEEEFQKIRVHMKCLDCNAVTSWWATVRGSELFIAVSECECRKSKEEKE